MQSLLPSVLAVALMTTVFDVTVTTPAKASTELPNYTAQQVCGFANDPKKYNYCVNREQEALLALRNIWKDIPEADRAQCVTAIPIAQMAYQHLWATCFPYYQHALENKPSGGVLH